MTIVGGMGTLLGPVLGAVCIILLQEVTNSLTPVTFKEVRQRNLGIFFNSNGNGAREWKKNG